METFKPIMRVNSNVYDLLEDKKRLKGPQCFTYSRTKAFYRKSLKPCLGVNQR